MVPLARCGKVPALPDGGGKAEPFPDGRNPFGLSGVPHARGSIPFH
jgi:hypothetical protein